MSSIESPAAPDQTVTRKRSPGSGRSLVLVLLLGTAAIGWGAYERWQRETMATTAMVATRDFRPAIRLATAERSEKAIPLGLPGDTAAIEQARIFARASGFLAERSVDIGSRVHAGQLLARIAAPDLDAQLAQAAAALGQREAALRQAEAQVKQAQSRKDLASVTDGRTAELARRGWASQQTADQTRFSLAAQDADLANATAGVAVAKANYATQLANVHQLQELTGYERVVAPFEGVVTARNVDVGDLIHSTGSTRPMFVVQRDDVLRIRVDVPQAFAVGVRDGLGAEIVLPERPGSIFKGVVARNAAALDPISRTLPVEVDVDNRAHLLAPGQFVNVTIFVPRVSPDVIVAR
jgi:Multidrug resistance efflux pump